MFKAYSRTLLLSALLFGAPASSRSSLLTLPQKEIKNNLLNISDKERAKDAVRFYKKALAFAKKLILQFNDEQQAFFTNVPGLLHDVITVKARLLHTSPIYSAAPYHSYAHTIGLALYTITQHTSQVEYAKKTFESLCLAADGETLLYQKEINRCNETISILSKLSYALSSIHTQVTQCVEYKNEKTK